MKEQAIIRELCESGAPADVAAAQPAAGIVSHGSGDGIASSFSGSGWSSNPLPDDARAQTQFNAKIAALSAMAAIPAFDPVATVDYVSNGNLLIIADSIRAQQAHEALAGKLTMSLLWTAAEPAPALADIEIASATLLSLTGYLGAFDAVFQSTNAAPLAARFDLVLDLRREPAFRMHQPPQGYLHAADAEVFDRALTELPDMIGEFEKPKFFAYKESICAHSRSKKIGCNKCIDICSTKAISSDGQNSDRVKVDAHLCMGCGACATVCPSGAMTYQYPRVSDRGTQMKTLLNAYRLAAKGQGDAPVVMFHNATDGREAIARNTSTGAGLPLNMLPIETWHVASTGLDVLLGAIAYGAGHVVLLAAGPESPDYVAALKREMTLAQLIVNSLGFAGTHFTLATDATALGGIKAGATINVPAGFNWSNDKRGTIEFAIEHLLRHSTLSSIPETIDLPAGSLFGAVQVDTKTCTLCMACAGACPESALMDGHDVPRLKFLERNCVQCGLCETTCPENAIKLVPRLLLTEQRKKEVVLNESEPFHCISCGETLGTKLMIDNMLGKLATHSMFQGEGQLKRLQMCANCRVVDMMSNKNEASMLAGTQT